jgi:hypothetical protein
VCWGTAANPSVAGTHSSDGAGSGAFVSNIPGLTPNTEYHVRAYATNSAGTAYGNERTFITAPVLIPTLTTNAITSVARPPRLQGGILLQIMEGRLPGAVFAGIHPVIPPRQIQKLRMGPVQGLLQVISPV